MNLGLIYMVSCRGSSSLRSTPKIISTASRSDSAVQLNLKQTPAQSKTYTTVQSKTSKQEQFKLPDPFISSRGRSKISTRSDIIDKNPVPILAITKTQENNEVITRSSKTTVKTTQKQQEPAKFTTLKKKTTAKPKTLPNTSTRKFQTSYAIDIITTMLNITEFQNTTVENSIPIMVQIFDFLKSKISDLL